MDVSVALCRAAAADGITHMVATPHANDRYHYDREYLKGVVAQLQELVGDSLKIGLGCDFHLSYDNIQDALANPTRYVIEDTRYLLVEFSNFSISEQTADYFFKLKSCGMTPVITHPERNPILRETPATSAGMGRSGLRGAGHRLRADRILGRSDSPRSPVAIRTPGGSRARDRCPRSGKAGSDAFHCTRCRCHNLRIGDRGRPGGGESPRHHHQPVSTLLPASRDGELQEKLDYRNLYVGIRYRANRRGDQGDRFRRCPLPRLRCRLRPENSGRAPLHPPR